MVCQGESYSGHGFSVEGIDVGKYSYTHHDFTEFGCDSITTLDITIQPLPNVDLGADIFICSQHDFPVVLDAGKFENYLWSNGATSQTTTISYPGSYFVTVTSEHGCINSDEIEVLDKHVDVSISQGADYCEEHVTTLTATTEAEYVYWNHGANGHEITIRNHGSYIVTASNGYCHTTSQIDVQGCPFAIYVPNTITPYLQDGINDFFSISGDKYAITQFQIHIYDRWGKLAYKSDDPDFKWDGKVDGELILNHTFSWVIIYSTIYSGPHMLKGHVNVL